jgi:predicted dehydrogenase
MNVNTRGSIGRRQFLRHGVLASASVWTARSWSNVAGANSDVRVAIVGVHGKGHAHVDDFSKVPGARVVAVCDPDRRLLDREQDLAQRRGQRLQLFTDLRKLYESPDIDAVVIATPNHWHALAAIWACQAGKDVYVEKPISHNVWEGRRLVEVVRATGRIVMAGTQQRSNEGLREAFAYLRSGELGRIRLVRGFCYKRRPSIGRVNGPQPIPPDVDYDLWCGPAPLQPLRRRSLHYDWHWVWETGNGDIGNQGIHELDLCRWVLGDPPGPRRVVCVGGRYVYQDDATTPNTQIALFEFEEAPVIFEVRGLPMQAGMETMDHYRGVRVGLVIECDDGYFAGGGTGGWIYDRKGNRVRQFPARGPEQHPANFIRAVQTRNPAFITAPIDEGHRSSTLPHLANISYRLGSPQSPEAARRILARWPGGEETFQRLVQHCQANEVDLEREKIVVGLVLEFDPIAERFRGLLSARAANQMLTHEYRPPYVIPMRV